MDYLNRAKTRRHGIILLVGYVLIAVAITISTLVLVYQAYGFGLSKGTVVQNGLVFFSSQPRSASIYLNGKLNSHQTNTRIALPANVYSVKMTRDGYRDWQRNINLLGGSVEHIDYPLLFPKTLTTKKIQTFTAPPGLMTQSPNLQWLLVEQPGSLTDFSLYDLKNPAKAPTALALPTNLLTKATTANNSLQFSEWADDNQHVLLQHNYDGKTEFVMVDRNDASQSVNLNNALSTNPTKLTLNNKKFDQYYLYDAATGILQTASQRDPTPVLRLEHVLAYKSYASSTVLYVTPTGAPTGKVLVKLVDGDKTTVLRSLPANDNYLVDLTQYSGTTYVVMGASSTNKVYIYRDPVAQLASQPKHAIVPIQVLHVDQPNYLSFSNSAQFIVTENGNHFGVYDIQNKLGYNYISVAPLDAPQTHANWMDGSRLIYSSSGKLSVADYDNSNRQSLMTADSNYLPAFSSDSKFVYSLAPSSSLPGQVELTQTPLLIPADQ